MSKEFFIIFTRKTGGPIELAKVKFSSFDELFKYFSWSENSFFLFAVASQEEKNIWIRRYTVSPRGGIQRGVHRNHQSNFDMEKYVSVSIETPTETNFLSFIAADGSRRLCCPIATGEGAPYARTNLNDLELDFMELPQLTQSPVSLSLFENKLNEILQPLSQKCDSVAFGNLEKSLLDLIRSEPYYLTKRPNEDKWIKFCESVVAVAAQSIVKN